MAKKTILYLGLGSNMGNKEENFKTALVLISSYIGRVVNSSNIYITAPWGNFNQDYFLNQVVCVETSLILEEIFEKTQNIELDMGRVKHEKWGSRLIDIDILFFGTNQTNTEKLTVPHPYIQERNFVLTPLAEIAPYFKHPVLKKNIKELQEDCTDSCEVRLLHKI